MRFIGDIHGKLLEYMHVAEESPDKRSIQVGDFGHFGMGEAGRNIIAGFHKTHPGHQFIRGNHDNPEDCKRSPAWIPDGTIKVIGGQTVFFVGGAWSIDYRWRTLGFDYWLDEELSYDELGVMLERYEKHKPDVMVTHDCPMSIAYELFIKQKQLPQYRTRTAEAFEQMFQIHKPKLWVFGHWHLDRDQDILGTRFICLSELNYIDIDLKSL